MEVNISEKDYNIGNDDYKVYFDFYIINENEVKFESVVSRAIDMGEDVPKEFVEYKLEEVVVTKNDAIVTAENFIAHIINTIVESRVPYTSEIHWTTRTFVDNVGYAIDK